MLYEVITKNNALNNGILPVQVSAAFLEKIFKAVQVDPKTELEVNLEKQQITLVSSNESESFEINPYKKECLLNGYDDIDYLLSIRDKIEAFEANRVN